MKNCLVCQGEKFETLVESRDFCVSQEDFHVAKCSACGFAYTVNAPNHEEIGKYYEHADYVSHTDTKEGLFFKIYHGVRDYMLGRKRSHITKHVQLKKSLDIGAGTGYFVNHLRENGVEAIGFEPDQGARQQAKNNFGLDLKPSLEEILESNEKFDAISMWHVLEHVHDLKAYFKHFQDLLKPGGVLAIAVPNYTSLDGRYYKKYWAAYDLPKHLWHFSPNSLRKLGSANGFTHAKSYAMPFDPFYIALLSEGHKKSGFFGKIRGAFIGKMSFIKGFFNSESSSSVVYIFKKN